MSENEAWQCTVVRAQGLRLMRPEKSWRPIVTLQVDQHHCHETVLGTDGQNPNLKESFILHDATPKTKLELKVWHCAQSKKKGKKRKLVGSASHSLAELIKKQEGSLGVAGNESRSASSSSKVEVRLQCQTASKQSISSKGRSQNKAILLLKLHAPRSVIEGGMEGEEAEEEAGYASEQISSSSQPSLPPSPVSVCPPPSTLRRRKVNKPRPYIIHSDDACSSESEYEYYEEDEEPSTSGEKDSCPAYHSEPEIQESQSHEEEGGLWIVNPFRSAVSESLSWIAASILPEHTITFGTPAPQYTPEPHWIAQQNSYRDSNEKINVPSYTEKLPVPPRMSRLERILASFTMYSELKEASVDSQYEAVFMRLQMEWTYVGGLLVALAAVDTAVFAISNDSMFGVNAAARDAIAASSIASGLGIACDAWFLLRYNWADLRTFIHRALDVYNSYFFFSLSARVPALCMFISALSLMGFLGLVAYDAFPQGVIVVCFLVGVVMSLQFLVYGVHRCVSLVAEGGRRGGRSVMGVVRKLSG
ncbi:hypothetical protein BDQ12DRAFT_688289 [Crucibulum laeve]|uniref:C2 domain-containing protein n=1 Tax=Crucibulum laeve TaxID=68775 RepID=A0A5C3LTL0_9AGAR|nr:hypothetical protein BDQ12DRAFT_688289 [Crucibulum laeve]